MKEYDTYLFDVDGTILDTMELIYRTFRATLSRFDGPDLTREVILSHVGIPLYAQLELYLGSLGVRRKEILEYHMQYQSTIYREYLGIFPGVKDVLGALKSKEKKLAVVTSRTGSSLADYLNHYGLTGFFDVIVDPTCTKNHKPHPEPALFAMEKLGNKPEGTLFIGDASVDMECGKAAGTDTAFVLWGPNTPEQLAVRPDWILTTMKDLLV